MSHRPTTLQDEQTLSAKQAGARLDERYSRLRFQRPELHLPLRSKISDRERNELLVQHTHVPTVNRSGNEGSPLLVQRCFENDLRQRARCFELKGA